MTESKHFTVTRDGKKDLTFTGGLLAKRGVQINLATSKYFKEAVNKFSITRKLMFDSGQMSLLES